MGSLPQLSILRGPTRKYTPCYIDKLLENTAEINGSNTALIFDDEGINARKLTYSELNSSANRLARSIKTLIVCKNLPRNSDGDYIVAVNMDPSDDLLVLLLAIWKAGAAYLPLDHAFPAQRIQHIMKEAKPALVVYDEDTDLENYLDSAKISYGDLLNQSINQRDDNLSQEKLQQIKDDLAVVLYTSGSTGIPKGVRLPHKVILNRLNWQFKAFPYAPTENVCVFKTALTFVDSISEIWGPLLNGLSLLVIPRDVTKNPEKLVALLDKYQIERLILVPSLLRSILVYLKIQDAANVSLRNLKTWICSGEILSASLAVEFYEFFPENEHQLCNFYGSTEIMGDVTYFIVPGLEYLRNHEKVPIGTPIDNTVIYLLDQEFRPVKAGQVGELFVAGLNLAAGYVNGRDTERFLNNPLAIDPSYAKLYRTGDFALLDKGMIVYEGRTDSQIKIRGNRVDLAEVERAVSSIDGVDKAVVLCYKAGEINQAILAFVTTTRCLSEKQIEAELETKLTSYMRPQVLLIDSMPLLVNGKIDRQSLLKLYENTNNNDDQCYHVDIDYSGVQPHRMEPAKVLFETVASVLNRSARSAISIKANFYELGGNSLNSIYTISKLNECGYRINIRDFLCALDLGEVLERMVDQKSRITPIEMFPPTYTTHLLKQEHRPYVLNIITSSFYDKADLERHVIDKIHPSDYNYIIDLVWEPMLKQNLSFLVSDESGKFVGVSLIFDGRDEPEGTLPEGLGIIADFLEFVEGPIRDGGQLPPGKNAIFHCYMMGTHPSLSSKDNVSVIQYMEEEVIRLARSRNFKGILTTNTNPLTQQLGTHVFQYQTMLEYQINQYVAKDGTKPFEHASDSEKVLVQWKPLS